MKKKTSSSNHTKIMTGIAEVQSFTHGRVAKARHYPELESTDSDYEYGEIIIVPFLLIALVPGMILGSIIKLLSYINNPIAQESHKFVKKMLTPVDKTINLEEYEKDLKEKPTSIRSYLYENLSNISVSGQHVNALTILGDTRLDTKCAKIINNLYPFKLILDEKVKATANQFYSENWDNTALLPPVRGHDYSGLGWECKNKNYPTFPVKTRVSDYKLKPMLQEKKEEKDWNLAKKDPNSSVGEGTLFYYPPYKKVSLPPTIVSSTQEALQHEPWASHTVYVVRKK